MHIYLQWFLRLITISHILSVFATTHLGLSNVEIALGREIFWVLLCIIVLVVYYKKGIYKQFFQNKTIRTLSIGMILLIVYAIIVSYMQSKNLFNIAVGMKYTLWYMALCMSGVFLGYLGKIKEKTISRFIQRIIRMIYTIVIAGVIRQIAKHSIPSFFMGLGYGPVGDFIFGEQSPLYYRTGPGGTPRLSGLFAGPNNYGYFLVLYTGVIIYHIRSKREQVSNKTKHSKQISLISLFFSSLLTTLSRGAILGGATAIVISFHKIFQKNKKRLVSGFVIIIGCLVLLSRYKGGSTLEHITRKRQGVQQIIEQPLGQGLGTSGPSIHHGGSLLPENYYLQIAADIGVVGLIIRCIRWIVFFRAGKKLIQQKYTTPQNANIIKFYVAMSIGLVGLLVEGMFLHVFEDSMVNYLFFIPYGILTGYLFYQKDKNL